MGVLLRVSGKRQSIIEVEETSMDAKAKDTKDEIDGKTVAKLAIALEGTLDDTRRECEHPSRVVNVAPRSEDVC